MGISGFYPQIKKFGVYPEEVELLSLSGQAGAFDGYAILHRYAHFDAKNLAQGVPTTRWISGSLNYLDCFHKAGIKIVLVFDGGIPPCKETEAAKRTEMRMEAQRKALALEKTGKMAEASRMWRQTLRVTTEMVNELVAAASARFPGLRAIHAPFEADPQLAYLARSGLVDFVVASDSDILVLGAPKLLTKIGDGFAEMYTLSDIENAMGFGRGAHFRRRLLYTSVLCGCDYLSSPPGIGPVSALALVQALITPSARDDTDPVAVAQAEEELLRNYFAHAELAPGAGPVPARWAGWTGDPAFAADYFRALTAFRCGWVICPPQGLVLPLEAAVATAAGTETSADVAVTLRTLAVPTNSELSVAEDLIGSPADPDGLGSAARTAWFAEGPEAAPPAPTPAALTQSQLPSQSLPLPPRPPSRPHADARALRSPSPPLPSLSSAPAATPAAAGAILSTLIARGRQLSQQSQPDASLPGCSRPPTGSDEFYNEDPPPLSF